MNQPLWAMLHADVRSISQPRMYTVLGFVGHSYQHSTNMDGEPVFRTVVSAILLGDEGRAFVAELDKIAIVQAEIRGNPFKG